jgi:hypothetical protein
MHVAAALLSILALLPHALASRFWYRVCECSNDPWGAISYAYAIGTSAKSKSGADNSGASANGICKAGSGHCAPMDGTGRKSVCLNTGLCGVKTLCWIPHKSGSDEFQINGKTYKKNSYEHSITDYWARSECSSLCRSYGLLSTSTLPVIIPNHGLSFQVDIYGYPEPKFC